MGHRALWLAGVLSIATAAHGQLSAPARECIDAYNGTLRMVSQQTGKSARTCLRNAAEGTEPSPDTCVVANSDGKIAAKAARVTALYSGGTCSGGEPIQRGAAVGSAAHRDAFTDLVHDLFGTPVTTALSGLSPTDSRCLDTAMKRAVQAFATITRGHRQCAKDGLQSGARRLNRPRGVAVEPASGDLYIANTGANTVEVYSAAGLWRATWDGSTSGATPFRAPLAVTTGGSGRVFVADTGNDLVQVFGSDGHWSARIGGADEGGLALSAPSGLAIDTSGNLWVAESGASRVQVFAPASASPTASREAPKRMTRLALPTPPNEFQFSGSVHYLARQIDPNPFTEFVMHYEGTASWTLTYVYDAKTGTYISDPGRSRIKGKRSKYYTSLQGGGTLCDQPAMLYDVGLLGTQQLSLVDLQNGTAMVPLTLPALLLAGCDTAGPGVILSSFNPPFASINSLPDFPTRALPDGWVAKFPASLLTTSASQLLWSDAYQGTSKLERVFSDGSKRIDIGEWTVTGQLSGVVPGAYVGLGDSFSAATGAPPTGPLPCLRSPQSYIELYDPRTPKNTIFAACSAATTDAITGSFKGNSPQASQIPYTADKVSITIGGNDAKLFSVLQTCVMMGALPLPCSTLRPTAIADARAITPKIQGALQAVKEAAPSARIGILEYPNPFPDNNTTGCLGLRNPKIPLLGVRALDVQFFHDLVAEVNNQVRAAAAATSVSFVPTAAAFVGHDMCAEPWFGPPSGGAETFHPNAAGNVAMKEALQAVLGVPN